MSIIQVAFPVRRGRRRFHMEKGRRWSLIEHLMLDAVARKPASAAELAAKADLPRRVIIEAFIRLMRVGWVEMSVTPGGPVFDATPIGRVHAGGSELRAATVVQPRWMGFAIDQVAGSVFRGRELAVRHRNDVAKSPGADALVWLDKSERYAREDLAELFAAMESEDEIVVSIDPTPERLIERFAVVTVTDGIAEGLPSRAKPELRAAVLSRAADAAGALEGAAPYREKIGAPPAEPAPAREQALTPGLFDQRDIIVDGPEHKAALESALRQAREQVVIHSTFVSETSAKLLLPLFLNAAAKGTRIHILWGQQDEERAGASDTRRAVAALQAAVNEAGRSDQVIVHPFTTRSHAKLLVFDDGAGRWSSIVGSCNWLYSGFESFEVSIRLRDPRLVGECIRHVATLSLGPPGVWHGLATELTILGRRVEALPRPNGRTAPMRLLLSPDHSALVLEARDRARRRIAVMSHRIGIAGRPMVIVPALAAAQAGQIEALLYYGRPTGLLSGIDAAGLAREYAREGVAIQPIHRPRLHAKILCWDDDALAVTSQNWLAADPAEGALLREMGVFVEARRIADNLLRRFELARTP